MDIKSAYLYNKSQYQFKQDQMNKNILNILSMIFIIAVTQTPTDFIVSNINSQIIDSTLSRSINYNTVVIQSDLNQYITSINTNPLTTHNTYNYGVNIPAAPNAVWVWASNWNKSGCPQNITITEYFQVTCDSGFTLYATADNSFTASINGQQVLTGNNWQNVYSVNVNSSILKSCGQNVLTITAKNEGDCSAANPAGVIYALVQNTSGCYKCPSGQIFNFKTCSCACKTPIPCRNCPKPQVWFDAPTCGCGCIRNVLCIQNAYFDNSRCACRCIPQRCSPNMIWDDKKCQCVYKCLPFSACKFGQLWNFLTCNCEPIYIYAIDPILYPIDPVVPLQNTKILNGVASTIDNNPPSQADTSRCATQDNYCLGGTYDAFCNCVY